MCPSVGLGMRIANANVIHYLCCLISSEDIVQHHQATQLCPAHVFNFFSLQVCLFFISQVDFVTFVDAIQA